MTLNFTKQGNRYVAEATVNNDYNLHIERKGGNSTFAISQCGTGSGQYAPCELPSAIQYPGPVIDWSFGHVVYPMRIQIISGEEVTTATLTEVGNE